MSLTTLASGLSYSGDAGAAGLVTSASVNPGNPGGTTYTYAASYDEDLRLLSSSLSVAGGGALLYQVQPGYDAASNVTAVDTTLGTGSSTSTDNQTFCYDEQNRLMWATSQTASGPNVPGTTTPCASNTAGSLTSGNSQYTATYAYDNLDRLTSGPANGGSSYSYGDAAHLHAATSTSGGYTATYDASGNMTCRAPTSATICTGSSPTGAGLTYDNEGQLVSWTSALNGNPTPVRASFAYDAEGSRVAQHSGGGALSAPTTTTDYLLGGLEELLTSTGGSRSDNYTQLSEYYPLPGGLGTAVRVTKTPSGGTPTTTLSYLASDQLGSVSVVLSTSGTVTAQALYSPYGTVRYSSGSMPTAHGYTGQLADAMTGLDYYGARSYDPALGQFSSADSLLAGLNRYAYVGGNPETATDPTGQRPTNREDPPPETGNPEIDALLWVVLGVYAAYDVLNAWLNTPVPMHPSNLPAPVAAPSAQPYGASPGSSQWTLPDKDYRQGAMQTHWAVGNALGGAVQQLGAGTNPGTGPSGPGPGTGPEPGPGTPPVTGPGGEPLGSSPNGEQGPEPQPSTEGAGSGVCCGCGCGGGSGGSGGVPPQGYGPAHSAINAAYLRQLGEYANEIGGGEAIFLDNGIIMFRGPLTPARNPGPSIGSQYVKAWNPETGFTLGWYETILADGTPKVIHLKDIDGITLSWGPHIVLTNGCLESWW